MMRSLLLICAAAALAAFGTLTEARAADGAPGYRTRAHHHAVRHHYRHCCYVGGYRFGYSLRPFTGTDAENYPGHYNNQNLWERVETQRNFPVGY